MEVGLDIPQRVREDSLLVARHFLLLKGPLGKLDFVREQVAAGHGMPEAEVSAQSPETLARLLVALVTLVDLHDPVVVGVTSIARDTVARHLLLEVDIRDRGTDVVRVEGLVGRDMPELDASAAGDVRDVVIGPVGVRVAICGRIDDAPVVVGVAVRVEGDLLL